MSLGLGKLTRTNNKKNYEDKVQINTCCYNTYVVYSQHILAQAEHIK
jgi:hypothetical protein